MKKSHRILMLVAALAVGGVSQSFAQAAYQNVYTKPLVSYNRTWSETKSLITSSASASAAAYQVTFYGYGAVVYYAVKGGTVAVSTNFLSPGTTTQFDPSLTPSETLLDVTAAQTAVSSPTIVTFTLQAQTVQPTTVYYTIGGWR